MAMDTEVTIVRVYLKEGDPGKKKRLVEELFELLKRQGLQGATVFHGIMGFGPHGMAQTDILHLAGNLPVIIEFFVLPAAADAAISALRHYKTDLNIVHWRASSSL
jgi:hypothetical protein